jgi:hypothetical protein
MNTTKFLLSLLALVAVGLFFAGTALALVGMHKQAVVVLISALVIGVGTLAISSWR